MNFVFKSTPQVYYVVETFPLDTGRFYKLYDVL